MTRPNTRKIYELHHGVVLAPELHVHHILPVRLGGTHDVENLVVLTIEEHALAHLRLFEAHQDPKDLYAHHMILGHTEESRRLAASMGGKESNRRRQGRPTGFQRMTKERRQEVARKAGAIGGAVQRELGQGIHADDQKRREWAQLGGAASRERMGFSDSQRQSERGSVGGRKNKGFFWYHDGTSCQKYTAQEQLKEPFDIFIVRTGFKKGRRP
jgi:hypothetical protein